MTAKRFTLGVCESGLGLTDNETKEQYLEVDDTTLIRLCEVLNGLSEENEQLKKALWCIRKRYGYTVEEFVEDLKDNGTDLSRVDLK